MLTGTTSYAPCMNAEKKFIFVQCLSSTRLCDLIRQCHFSYTQKCPDVKGAGVWKPDGLTSYNSMKTNSTGYILCMCVYQWKRCFTKYVLCA